MSEVDERTERKETARREIFTHLMDLRDRCDGLGGPYPDPINVFNSIQALKSLVGQIESAALRYRRLS